MMLYQELLLSDTLRKVFGICDSNYMVK